MSSIDVSDTTFGQVICQLREQIELLKQRCISAEATVAALSIENRVQQHRIEELTQDNQRLDEQYHDLIAGTSTGASPEEIERLRDRYLAMIREIDDCIDKLNGR